MVIQLGLSFGDLSAALLKEAKNGAISWHEYNVEIAGVAEAFKPGLEAVGAYGQAFKNLIDSAGQGMQSVKSFKDIAVEAQEAGVTSMDELKKRLLAGGMDPEYVNALFASAAQRGITTLDQWANASDETSGAIVGDMEAMSKKLADQWEKLRTSISDLTDQINAIPTEVTSNIKINITSTLDDNAKKVLDSGIGIKVPTSTITGPSVSGSVKSFSSTSNAAANVLNAQPMSITINAQGAGAGVENTIRRVLVAEMPNITNSILNNYSSGYQRG